MRIIVFVDFCFFFAILQRIITYYYSTERTNFTLKKVIVMKSNMWLSYEIDLKRSTFEGIFIVSTSMQYPNERCWLKGYFCWRNHVTAESIIIHETQCLSTVHYSIRSEIEWNVVLRPFGTVLIFKKKFFYSC